MSENKLGQEPAFPTQIEVPYNFEKEWGGTIESTQTIDHPGISKRFYAACAAMQSLISSSVYNVFDVDAPAYIVHKAYELADELLKQENE